MISIIITAFEDDRQYLKKAVSSCLVQDMEAEIIVVDGSETPMDANLVDFIKVVGAKLLVVSNKGQYHSLNEGIEVAKHELILVVDADDTLMPDVLWRLVRAMDWTSDIVFGNCRDQDGKISIPYGFNGITKETLLACNPIFFTSLFKRWVWRMVGGFKPVIYCDYRFFVEAYKRFFNFRYTDLLIYQHNKRPGSITDRYAENVEQLNREAIIPLLEN